MDGQAGGPRANGGARRALLVAVAVVVAACGGGQATVSHSPSPAPTSSSATQAPATGGLAVPSPQPLPDPKIRTVAEAANSEVALSDRLRAEAGIAALIGADGAKALEAIEKVQTAYGEKTLSAYARQLGLSVPPGSKGRTATTSALMVGTLASAIVHADETNAPASLTSSESYPPRLAGSLKAIVSLKSRVTLSTGAGQVSGDIETISTSLLTDKRTGKEIGRLVRTTRGHVEVNGCPNPEGVAAGRVVLALEEEFIGSTGAKAGFTSSIDVPYRLVDGDDAHVVRTELDATVVERAHGATGSPSQPFGRDLTAFVPTMAPAKGTMSIDASRVTVKVTSTTQEQFADAYAGGILRTSMVVGVAATQAEEFWRSGACIAVTANEQSRVVAPGEKIGLSVGAVHRFDAQPVSAPIAAVLTGSSSLEQTGTPADSPATFEYKAGTKPGQAATIELAQVSSRGIGTTSLVLTVRSRDLLIGLDGSFVDGTRLAVHLVVVELRLAAGSDGTYAGTGKLEVTSTYSGESEKSGTCGGSVQGSAELKVVGRRDKADPTRVRLSFTYAYVPIPYTATCSITGSVRDDAGKSVRSWVYPLLSQVATKVGTPANARRALGGALMSSARITVTEAP